MHGEISALALKFMQDFAMSPVPHAIFLIEDETKDEAQLFKQYYETNRAWNNLIDLGLTEDARANEMYKWVGDLEQRTQRTFRVFKLTEYGRLFNGPNASDWIN